MDVLNRIKYDMLRGGWGVLFKGKPIAHAPFKNAGEAHQYLESLRSGKEVPVWSA